MRVARLHRRKRVERTLKTVASRLRIEWLLGGLIQKVSFVRSVYGPLLYNTPGDQTFGFCINGYGPFVSEVIARWDDDFLFLDIGANLGLFSLIAVCNPHCRQAIAFEPVPEIFNRLRLNVARNNAAKITPLQGAIVDSTAEEVHLSFNPKHSGMSRITTDTRHAVRAIAISAPELDAIVRKASLPILAKIDVEGSEPEVLSALRRTHFYGRVSGIIIEISERNLGAKHAELLEALRMDDFHEVGRSGGVEHYDALYRRSVKP